MDLESIWGDVKLYELWFTSTVHVVASKSHNTSLEKWSYKGHLDILFLTVVATVHDYYELEINRDKLHCQALYQSTLSK